MTSSPVELSINASDADFGTSQGDNVTVEFRDGDDDSLIGSKSITANQTVTAEDAPMAGTNSWYVEATDEYGNTVTSDTFTYQTPEQLEIRDITNQSLITESGEVELEFYGADGTVEQRTTTDGTINMAGLPVDERFSVTVTADGYITRQVLIESVLDQQTVYLLANTTDTVTPRFKLEDPTNQFSPEESEIVFKRPLQINGSTKFVAVAGDRIGLNGFDTTLEEGQRYRVVVTDPESNAQRELGEFTASRSELITFTVEDVEFDSVADVEGIEWTARYITNEESDDQIEFVFRDEQPTDTVQYRIYERGNESNTLVDSTSTGNVTLTEAVPPDQPNTVWVVEWVTERADGERLSGQRVVSTDQLPVTPSLDGSWQTIIAMIALFAVAGLFGAVNPGVGGVAVASTGGMFYLIGWLPDSTGGLMVLLALFIAVLAYTGRRARGATA